MLLFLQPSCTQCFQAPNLLKPSQKSLFLRPRSAALHPQGVHYPQAESFELLMRVFCWILQQREWEIEGLWWDVAREKKKKRPKGEVFSALKKLDWWRFQGLALMSGSSADWLWVHKLATFYAYMMLAEMSQWISRSSDYYVSHSQMHICTILF